MDAFGILDLVIGICFIYFTFSVVCTALVEVVVQAFLIRSWNLNVWIRHTFNKDPKQKGLGNYILKHELIEKLTKKGRKASFIPTNVFTAALFDLIHTNGDPNSDEAPYDLKSLKASIESTNMLPVQLKRYLLQAIKESVDDSLTLVKKRFEDWFNESMTRIGGTFKMYIRYITMTAAVLVSASLNIDSVTLFKYLKENPEATAKLVQAAEASVQDSILYRQAVRSQDRIDSILNSDVISGGNKGNTEIKDIVKYWEMQKNMSDSLYTGLKKMGLPLGWERRDVKVQCDPCKGNKLFSKEQTYLRVGETWFSKFTGLLITALALTLGAPFWFDMINKLVNIRSSGNKPGGQDSPGSKKAAG